MRFKNIINEMSRASDRTLGRESMANVLYVLQDFANKNQGKVTPNQTYKFIERYYGDDAEKILNMLNIKYWKGSTGRIDLNWNINNWAKKYNIDLDDNHAYVEENKDKYDDMIDTFWAYYKAKSEGNDLSSFDPSQDKTMQQMIDMFRNDPEKAKEVFGKDYDKAVRWLAPYVVKDYAGSYEEAIDEFWDWHRARKAGDNYRLSEYVLDKLEDLLNMPDAERIIGNKGLFFYVAKMVGEMAGHKVIHADETALERELKRIMKALDDPKYIDQIEKQEKRRIASGNLAGSDDSDTDYFGSFSGNFGGFAIPIGVIKKIAAVAAEEGSIDKSKVGKVDKKQVVESYKYCMNQLNRKFHVGQRGAFEGTIQEFYDKFKIVFNHGYTTRTLFKIFDEVTTFMVDQIDKETAEYWKNKEEISDVDDFNEAKRLLLQAGYTLFKD